MLVTCSTPKITVEIEAQQQMQFHHTIEIAPVSDYDSYKEFLRKIGQNYQIIVLML